MVFVETEDGKRIGPIKNWCPTRISNKIKKLIITDGSLFYREISGYNYYAMSTEKISSNNSMLNGVSVESIYGILDLTSQKKELLSLYNKKIKKLSESNINDKDLEQQLKKLKSKYTDLITILDNAQVCSYSLAITGSLMSVNDACGIHVSDYKKGLPQNPSLKMLLGNSLKVLS